MLQREQSNNRRYNSSNLILLIADTHHKCDHCLSDESAIQNDQNSSQKIHKSLDETERL